MCSEGTFSTSTVDVSLGGLRLADNLPSEFNRPFKIRLSDKNHSVELTCQPILLPNGDLGNRVRIVDRGAEDALRLWMLSTRDE